MPINSEAQVIISDTSCLIALTNIGYLTVLQQLYGKILITPEVAIEYEEQLPEWISIKTVLDTAKINDLNRFIDLGESSAIALAIETEGAVLIVDDGEARKFAINLGLKITGTLGLLIRAYNQGIISDLADAIFLLKKIGFHLPGNIDELISL